MKNNKTQPKAVPGTAMVKKTEKTVKSNASALVILKPSEQTPEDLKAENERLKKELAKVPEELSERISYYKQKQVWITTLSTIRSQRDSLLEFESKLFDELEQDEFTTDKFAISIVKTRSYQQDETILKVGNPTLVGVVLREVLNKISEKIDELEINIAS